MFLGSKKGTLYGSLTVSACNIKLNGAQIISGVHALTDCLRNCEGSTPSVDFKYTFDHLLLSEFYSLDCPEFSDEAGRFSIQELR